MTHSKDAARSLVDDAGARLRTRRVGRAVRVHDVVSSTNDLALAWAAEGAPDGAVVYAEAQERGRGRMGRSWSAQSGVNLTFSVIFRPPLPPDRWGLVTIASGVAVSEAVDAFADPLRTQIKWPNDILLNARKCCGMLLESSWSARREAAYRNESDGRRALTGQGDPPAAREEDPPAAPRSSQTAARRGDKLAARQAVILGIGVNVNQDAFPPDLEARATSILLEAGRPVSRPDLLAALLEKLEATLDLLFEDEAEVRRRYVGRMRDLNASVELRFAGRGGSIRGVATGLNESGGLLLETEEGVRVCHAGEVTRSD